MDTFNVRIVYRVIDIEPGTGSQRLVVDKQRPLFQGSPRVIFVEAAKGLLFRLANQNNGVTCVKKLTYVYSKLSFNN